MENKKIHDQIGTLIRQERKRQGLTLRELADASKLNTLTIAKVERGIPSTSTSIITLCRKLNISIVFTADEASKPVVV